MNENNLVLNDDKTHLIVMTNKSQSSKRNDVFLKAGNYTIHPTGSETLLGAHVCQNLKGRDYILDNKR